MIRVLVFIRKRPDLSAAAFKDYYERHHVGLVNRIFPTYSAYRRNFVGDELFGQPRENAYDAVTELEFATRADFETWQATTADPEKMAELRADEEKFILPAETRLFVVDSFGFK